MSTKIRRDDHVLVIAGNDKGKTGVVLSRSEDRVVVKDINKRKKHMKPTQQMQGGRIVEMEMPIHISNVMLAKKDSAKALKVSTKTTATGRVLVYKNSGEDHRPVKESGKFYR
jgi:large subunit ribosomal protein L24